MLKREVEKNPERDHFWREVMVLTPSREYYMGAGMFLLLAYLGAVLLVQLVQILIAFVVIVGFDATYTATSSWGDGDAALAAVATIGVLDAFALAVVVGGFCGLWVRWRLAGAIRRAVNT